MSCSSNCFLEPFSNLSTFTCTQQPSSLLLHGPGWLGHKTSPKVKYRNNDDDSNLTQLQGPLVSTSTAVKLSREHGACSHKDSKRTRADAVCLHALLILPLLTRMLMLPLPFHAATARGACTLRASSVCLLVSKPKEAASASLQHSGDFRACKTCLTLMRSQYFAA